MEILSLAKIYSRAFRGRGRRTAVVTSLDPSAPSDFGTFGLPQFTEYVNGVNCITKMYVGCFVPTSNMAVTIFKPIPSLQGVVSIPSQFELTLQDRESPLAFTMAYAYAGCEFIGYTVPVLIPLPPNL